MKEIVFKLLPFSDDIIIHEDILECLGVEGVLERDFGPWKKGKEVTLWFDFVQGTCKEFNDKGELTVGCSLSIHCTEELPLR